jgi:hypothetical protein
MRRNTSSFSLCHNATLSTKVQCDQAIAYRSTRAIHSRVTLGETDLICYIANPQQPKIVLTDDMLPRIVRYYHLTAQHAEGMDRLEWLLKQHFYHLCLRDEVHLQVSHLEICQKMKHSSTNFAQLPA